jgi:hypothetical protein
VKNVGLIYVHDNLGVVLMLARFMIPHIRLYSLGKTLKMHYFGTLLIQNNKRQDREPHLINE